jgi:hypothetical protein
VVAIVRTPSRSRGRTARTRASTTTSMQATSACRARIIARLSECEPVAVTLAKNAPPRLSGAISGRSAFVPECDVASLTAQRAPRRSSSRDQPVASCTTTALR